MYVMFLVSPSVLPLSSSSSLTVCEEYLLVLMRAHRGFEMMTLALIFNIDRRRVGEVINKHMPTLKRVGEAMGLLDMDLTINLLVEVTEEEDEEEESSN